jgi:ABC-2 type transport system permease protein
MHKMFTIARRETSAMIATKAFLFTLVMMPILMFGGIFLMPRLNRLSPAKTQRISIADGTGMLMPGILAANEARNTALRSAKTDLRDRDKATEAESEDDDGEPFGPNTDLWQIEATLSNTLDDGARLKLSDEIRSGSLYAFVEIPPELLNDGGSAVSVPFVSQDAAISSARQWLQGIIQQQVRSRRLHALGLDPAVVAKADVPVGVNPVLPYTRSVTGGAETKGGTSILVTLFLPFGVMALMFLVIFLAAQPMLESAMEEKGQRIAEVLLGSVSPSQLMAGKLLGNLTGSMLIFVIYGCGCWLVLHHNHWEQHLPWSLVPWFIVFQVLGVVLFSSVFLTIGAAISELKEAQSLLLPVWLLLLAPMMVWLSAVREPNGPVALALSFFPPSAPLMMVLRLASGQTIPVWQPPAAAMLLLATSAAIVYLAGRIYRTSLLRVDSARSFRQLLQRLTSQ